MNEIEGLLDKEKDLNKATASLKAMAYSLRLKILCVLKERELGVLDIVKEVGSSQSNISQHIGVLRIRNIISSRRVGNKILCMAANNQILKLVAIMSNIFCETNK